MPKCPRQVQGEREKKNIAKFVHHAIDLHVTNEKAPTTSCKKGCSHCCQQMVFVTDDEAELLYEELNNQSNGVIPHSKMVYLQEQAKYNAGDVFDFWRLPKEKSSCVFLSEEDTCTVYENRPAACRLFSVTSDPKMCSKEETLKGGGLVDRSFSLSGELWASAALGVQKEANKTLPAALLEQIDKNQKKNSVS